MTPQFPAQITANLVTMARQSKQGKSAMIVEGPKDSRFFKKVVNLDRCAVFVAGNRKLAQDSLEILERQDAKGVLAVVDGDLDHLAGRRCAGPNLLVTHTRDIEGIVLCTEALKDLLVEFDLPSDAFGENPGLVALEAMAPLGYLRHVIDQKQWQVRSSQIDYLSFIDASTMACDSGGLCVHLQSLTITGGVSAADYASELRSLDGLSLHPSCVARGHDVTEMIAAVIRKRRGTKRKHRAPIDGDLIESYLRVAYPISAFVDCPLGKQIRKWEARNDPYRVLGQ